jgi:hypothetical protein
VVLRVALPVVLRVALRAVPRAVPRVVVRRVAHPAAVPPVERVAEPPTEFVALAARDPAAAAVLRVVPMARRAMQIAVA